MAFLADDLYNSIQRGITLPSYQPLLAQTDILALADEEIQTKIAPMVHSLMQGYFVTTTTSTVTQGVDVVPIPSRAMGRTIVDIKIVLGTQKKPLRLIPAQEEHTYVTAGTPEGFFFRGDGLVVRPVPNATIANGLEIWYPLRPSKLILTGAAGLVVSTTSTTVTMSTLPSGLTANGQTVDFITASGGHSILAMDQAVTSGAGTLTLTFASVPSTLQAGDYVALAGTSPVVQLPDDLFQVVAQATQCRILEAIGDVDLLQAAKQTLNEKVTDAEKLMAPRVQLELQKVVNKHGLLRRGRSRFGRRL